MQLLSDDSHAAGSVIASRGGRLPNITAVFICSSLLFAGNIQHTQHEAQLSQRDHAAAVSVSFGPNITGRENSALNLIGFSPTTVT